MEKIKTLIRWSVLLGGFLNAGGIAMQAIKLMEVKDSSGHTPTMYFIFVFIQASLVANSVMHKDWWQGSGLVASMITTIWTLVLIFTYG